MARPSPALAAPFALALLVALVAPTPASCAISWAERGYDALVDGINKANENAKVCNFTTGCFGDPVTVKLNMLVVLPRQLPSLLNNAFLIVDGGACSREGGRCPINGMKQFPIFTGAIFGAPSKMVLSSLVLFNADGGALRNAGLAEVYDCVFRDNVGGAVTNSGAPGGAPLQILSGCYFEYNVGGAIVLGNPKFGLANNGTGVIVRSSEFRKNRAEGVIPNGGAVWAAGFGRAVFEDVTFVGNTAANRGGAVYGDETTLVFRNATFLDNVALGGEGGAVAGVAGFFQPFSASFCSCSFSGNAANSSASSLWFQSYFAGTSPLERRFANATFCDTAVPPGTVVQGSVVVGSDQDCPAGVCGEE